MKFSWFSKKTYRITFLFLFLTTEILNLVVRLSIHFFLIPATYGCCYPCFMYCCFTNYRLNCPDLNANLCTRIQIAMNIQIKSNVNTKKSSKTIRKLKVKMTKKTAQTNLMMIRLIKLMSLVSYCLAKMMIPFLWKFFGTD